MKGLTEQIKKINAATQCEYFKVIESKVQFWGERYFKVSPISDTVTQACICPGPANDRGKMKCIGIYFIAKQTFFSNYFTFTVEKCTKEEYDRQVEQLIKILI